VSSSPAHCLRHDLLGQLHREHDGDADRCADRGSTFAGWSGACSGTGSCTVSMTAARSVTATFNPISYTLTVSKGGMATASSPASPSGIDCGADCTEDYSSAPA